MEGRFFVSIVIIFAAVLLGVPAATTRAWVCDDAFISFRYAQNLVRGHGLVFNIGEHVEGYTNFLWTVWCALGMVLGFDVEGWAIFWGIICCAGTILLLGYSWFERRKEDASVLFPFPMGAMSAAVHSEWHVYATGGLGTSLFTFLSFAGYVLVTRRRYEFSGLVYASAVLTRPDGVLFAALSGGYILLTERANLRSALRFGVPFFCIFIPFTLWRHFYYGDWYPNTYYAKSADLSWYAQGWRFVRL